MNSHCTSDETLVSLLKNDDQVAFELLYNRYWRQLFSFIYKQTLSKEESEEIVHELMLGLWNNRKVTNISNLRLYLFIAARNQVNKFIRSKIQIKKYREFQLKQEQSETLNTDTLFNENSLNTEIEKVLNRIPAKTALIFKMHKIEELSIRKIAIEMGLTEKAVEYHITKSMKMMRHHLKKYKSNS